MPNFRKPENRDGFRIAIICALTHERDAVMEMLDESWNAAEYRRASGDINTYRVGRIGPHNVVIAQLPGMGTQEAASTSASFRSSFTNITLGLVVGVCGAVPTKTGSCHILLGDVIVSREIVDFTFGRQYDQHFRIKDTLADRFGRSNREIRSFLNTMEGKQDRARLKSNSSMYLTKLWQKGGFESSQFPGTDRDIAYLHKYRHKHQKLESCATCMKCKAAEDALEEAEAVGKPAEEIRRLEEEIRRATVCDVSKSMSCEDLECDVKKSVLRNCRDRTFINNTAIREPEIHFGVVGSGNFVLKSGYLRDELAEQRKIVAFEMEGAGVWDNFPTVVVKGVCDYADSHKGKDWQYYAAASAAACMKALLMEWQATDDSSSDIARAVHIPQRFPFPRNDAIIIRKSIFSTLEKYLSSASPSQSAALWGLGGSGKTQIALEFAYRRHLEQHLMVFWVHASSYDQFLQGYRRIATDVGLASTLQGSELLTAVRLWLEDHGNWLLILDNADDLTLFGIQTSAPMTDNQTILMSFVPRGAHGSILWTTRDERAVGHLVGTSRGINVEGMTDDEAVELLTGLSGVAKTAHNATELSEILTRLECLPLAISQAAAFIRAQHMSYSDYLRRLRHERKRWRILTQDASKRFRVDGVPNNVMETWQITVNHLERIHPLAHWILMVIVYFHNQDIPWLLIKTVGVQRLQYLRRRPCKITPDVTRIHTSSDEDSDAEEDDVRSALSRLTQFSLVRPRIDHGQGIDSYDIHPLVQDATRCAIWQLSRSQKPPAAHAAADVALSVLSQVFPSGNYETWQDCARLITHVLTFWQWPDLAHQRFRMCKVLICAWGYLFGQGRWSEAEKVVLEVFKLQREVLGEKHPDTLKSMTNLASTYYQQGQSSNAERTYLEALELQKEVLGETHPDTIWTMACLAGPLDEQGRSSEAEMIYIKVLKLQREILGEKHGETLVTMANLAATYRKQGWFSEAEKMNLEILELNRELRGEKHPDTILSMANLALIYHRQGRSYTEKIFVEVIKLQREVLGKKHPDTITMMSHLAAMYREQGRSKAEKTYLEVLELQREVLGEKDPRTIVSMACLAAIYHDQGRSEVEEMNLKVLELRREVLGVKHPDTITSMIDVANTYYRQGRREAEKILLQALELQQEVLGENDPATIRTKGLLRDYF